MKRLVGLVAGVLVVAGCGAEPSAARPAPDPDAVVCAGRAATADTVEGIAADARKGPILPAGVALFLLDARRRATMPVHDPGLRAAQAELVAAIDDLDAQGKRELPPGGNPAQDAVQLDPTRIEAAVRALDRACVAAGH